ncbi:MAG: UDP-glucose 4-epimerase [Sorangiineae bacterium NIC37A_2]|nr:MAG: UDP-glucose 4-epimerase [Sorangiineae bacterium NIC37A_2]
MNSPTRAPRTVLVTGAAGFIGSHVTDELIARGLLVVALDDLSGGYRENVHPLAHFVEGSTLDVPLLERLFRDFEIDAVIHLAAYAAEGLSHYVKRFNYESNLIGSVNLINASVNASVHRFIFTSSVAVYGDLTPPLHEDMRPLPHDPYGIAKWAVERELEISHRLFGLPYVIFRPHNVYGVRQNFSDRYRNVVGIFMNQILKERPLTVFGDGTQTRAFTHVSDVAPVLVDALFSQEAVGQVFNLGADESFSILELAERVSQAMGVPLRVEHLPARPEARHNEASHKKARKMLGYRPQVALETGLREMAEWVRKVGPRPTQRPRPLEIPHNLPPSWAPPDP